jgi:hypothetical protein
MFAIEGKRQWSGTENFAYINRYSVEKLRHTMQIPLPWLSIELESPPKDLATYFY